MLALWALVDLRLSVDLFNVGGEVFGIGRAVVTRIALVFFLLTHFREHREVSPAC